MSNQEFRDMMNKLVTDEEKILKVNNPEFLKRHDEILSEANRQLYDDLMMEQRETM